MCDSSWPEGPTSPLRRRHHNGCKRRANHHGHSRETITTGEQPGPWEEGELSFKPSLTEWVVNLPISKAGIIFARMHRMIEGMRLSSGVPNTQRPPPTIHTYVEPNPNFVFMKWLSSWSIFSIWKLPFPLHIYVYVLLLPLTRGQGLPGSDPCSSLQAPANRTEPGAQ